MALIDRYLLHRVSGRYVAVLATVMMLMSIENLSRLLPLLQHVRDPIGLLGRFMLSLLPEYATIGILVALLLAVALTARQLSLSGEWQIFGAIGLPPRRLLRVPLAIALVSAGAQLAIRFDLQPAGEQWLDRLGEQLERGTYGLGISAKDISTWGRDTIFSVERIDQASGRLLGVFLKRGATILTARTALARQDENGNLDLALENGQIVRQVPGDRLGRLDFTSYSVTLATSPPPTIHRRPSDSFDRIALTPLLAHIAREHGRSGPKPALAALASRCGYAVFCLLIPGLAISLGMPATRGRGGLGIMTGILLIVAFVRGTMAVESRFADIPMIAACVHLALWTGFTWLLWRFELRHGPGACETLLGRLIVRPLHRLTSGFAGRIRRDG